NDARVACASRIRSIPLAIDEFKAPLVAPFFNNSVTSSDLPSTIKVEQRSRSNSEDRKSTRLNSSHVAISYAVFCLKKKTQTRDLLQALGETDPAAGRPIRPAPLLQGRADHQEGRHRPRDVSHRLGPRPGFLHA